MIDIFYLLGVFIVIINVICLLNYKVSYSTIEWIIKYKEITGSNPSLIEHRGIKNYHILLFWSITTLLSISWIIFGLLTKIWFVFLGILLINFILNKLIYSVRINRLKNMIILMKSLTLIITIVILIYNHFNI